MGDYSVLSLWRYPVKSMAGEELEAVEVTARGLNGDRAYALVDTATKKVGSAKSVKKFGELLKCSARFVAPPTGSWARSASRCRASGSPARTATSARRS